VSSGCELGAVKTAHRSLDLERQWRVGSHGWGYAVQSSPLTAAKANIRPLISTKVSTYLLILYCLINSWNGTVFVAAPFIPVGSNYSLDQIDLPLALVDGMNSVTVNLMTDSSGVPGTAIESWIFNDLGPFPNSRPPLSVSSVLHPVLDTGTEYWLVALATDPSTVAVWNLNSIGNDTTLAFSYDGGANWITTVSPAAVPAFDVLGTSTAIPEPSPRSMFLVGLGLAGLACTLRKERMRFRGIRNR
jgi:hypothetical protein